MFFEELKDELKKKLIENGVIWDKYKKVYFTRLHRDFFLKAIEAKSELHLEEFCRLLQYLRANLQYGVSTEWADSDLNKYIYRMNKMRLIEKFPLTIDALCRFYADSDIISFYKNELKAEEPTIIDLVGTTGAGKTTFCQQFVDAEGKEILGKTITSSGNSTIIQTDIAIFENTKSRLFLKARSKSDILRDIILVALNVDPDYNFNLKKSITDSANKKGLNRDLEKEVKVDSDIFQGVYNLFRNERLMELFLNIAKELQSSFTNEADIQKYVNDNISSAKLAKLIEDIIDQELQIPNFYGYRHEILLHKEYILEKTIIPTKNFNKNKEQKDEYADIISYRILFEQAILVLNCDEKAKQCLPRKFSKGVVFRDSQGHKKSEQVGIATDFEVKNKILLIPAGTGGELVDDKYVEELKNIIISEPKQNIIVITKLDKTSSYEEYTQHNYDAFIESLKEQVVTTHNNLVSRLVESSEETGSQSYKIDRNAVVKRFIESFDNAFLSKIVKDKNGNYDAELLKISCSNKSGMEISSSDIEDIDYKENWYTLIAGILEREDTVSYEDGGITLKSPSGKLKEEDVMEVLLENMDQMLGFCIKNTKWLEELDKALEIYMRDFRTIYNEFYLWNIRSIKRDNGTASSSIEDKVSKVVKYIYSLITVNEEKNAVEAMLEVPLTQYLQETYHFDERLDVEKIAKLIMSNAIGRAAMVSYKLYDRSIVENTSAANIESLYEGTEQYVKPSKEVEGCGVYRRGYYTDTAYYLAIYCNLLSKFKYNLESHYLDIFAAILKSDLESLHKKAMSL